MAVTGTSISDSGVPRRYGRVGETPALRQGVVAEKLVLKAGVAVCDRSISSFGSDLRLSRGPGVLKLRGGMEVA